VSVGSLIARGRAAAARLMVDTCTIVLEDAEPVYDEATDTYTYDASSTVYTGACKVQSARAMAATPEAGAELLAVSRRELHLPITTASAAVRPDMVATITASSLNPGLVGRKFRLSDLGDEKSLATARRFGVEEV
jgi:hypothetical protein